MRLKNKNMKRRKKNFTKEFNIISLNSSTINSQTRIYLFTVKYTKYNYFLPDETGALGSGSTEEDH